MFICINIGKFTILGEGSNRKLEINMKGLENINKIFEQQWCSLGLSGGWLTHLGLKDHKNKEENEENLMKKEQN